MSSQLRPGATGLNRIMLDKEAALKEFFMNLLSGPEGFNESNNMPMGPPRPETNPLAGANSIGPRATIQPDSGYGAPNKGAFGLNDFAPLMAAAFTGRTPGEQVSASPTNYTGELPAVKSNTPPVMNGALPPEIMQMVDQMVSAGGAAPKGPQMAVNGTARPPRMPQGARSARPRPFMGPPESLNKEEGIPNLAGLMGKPNNYASAIPETFTPEPYDGPAPMSTNPMLAEENDPYDAPATDEYLGALRARPRHDDFEGSKGRRIISGILKGLLGGDFGIGDAPHQKALRSWRDEGSGLEEAATMEQKGLDRDRLIQKAQGDLLYKAQKLKQDYEFKIQKLTKIDMQREERERLKDEYENEYKTALIELRRSAQTHRQGVDNSRLRMEGDRTRAYVGSKTGAGADKNVSATEQGNIHKEAKRIVANDPRYKKWSQKDERGEITFDSIPVYEKNDRDIKKNRDGTPVLKEKIDDVTRNAIAAEIVKQEGIVGTRKRSSYGSSSGFDSPFDMPEEEFDMQDLFR